jgi:hypothetical protein
MHPLASSDHRIPAGGPVAVVSPEAEVGGHEYITRPASQVGWYTQHGYEVVRHAFVHRSIAGSRGNRAPPTAVVILRRPM